MTNKADIKQEYMTTPELAKLAGLRDSRIRQLIIAGEIPAVKMAGIWLIARTDAEKWLEERKQKGGTP